MERSSGGVSGSGSSKAPRTLCITAAVSTIISLPAYLCLFVSAISLSDGLSLALIDQQPGGGRKEGTTEREKEGGSEEQGPFPRAVIQRTVGEGGASGVWRQRPDCVHKLAVRDKLSGRRTPELVKESAAASQSVVSDCLSVHHGDTAAAASITMSR